MSAAGQVTPPLVQWKQGGPRAIGLLTPPLLRRASPCTRYLRNEHASDTVRPTALVHEGYMRHRGAAPVQLEEVIGFSSSRSRLSSAACVEETAQALGVSLATVASERFGAWRAAQNGPGFAAPHRKEMEEVEAARARL